jgi:pSer/pThr/pTyr-binding forkhead associated (FHA) protein
VAAPEFKPQASPAPKRITTNTTPRKLSLIFQGECYFIDKAEFLIGRDSRNSDLVIANNDISRTHAKIVLQDGQYFIEDNESVNGIECNGQHIKKKEINEGDVFWLASYELRFTYQIPATQPSIRIEPTRNPPVPIIRNPPAPIARNQTLTLIFQGEQYAIDKDEFVIGRSPRSSDLVISNNDISRKHASIICRDGQYFIKDNGSTMGIEYSGMRIDNKKIEEGDVFWLASYELRFTYRT